VLPFLQRSGLAADPPTAAQAALTQAACPLVQERVSQLTEAADMLAFLFVPQDEFRVNPDDAAKVLTADTEPVLRAAEETLAKVEPWDAATIETALKEALVDGLGLKAKVAFAPVRVAVTGRRVSPPLYQSICLLGRDLTLARLSGALAALG
jgi:glutamyl-tRNA synthetase